VGVVISLLLGWWVYAILDQPWGPEFRDVFSAPLFLVGIPWTMAMVRVMRYCASYSPPINIWGRIFTLRWIIPGYDKVFVAPLLMMALTFLAGGIMFELHLDPTVVAPIAISCASLICLNMGPSLLDWRHTGNHRIAPKFNPRLHLRL
jgi:hypothetical protein